MTQTERVLAALRRAGDHGMTQVDWLRYPTPDGGPPITRVAARIDELRDAGHKIASGERRDKCVVYRLTSLPRVEGVDTNRATDNGTAASEAASPAPAALFDTQPGFDDLCPPAPRSAIYDDDQEAA